MKIDIAAVGRLRDRNLRALMDDYVERIGRYVPVEETEVKEGGARKPDDRKAAEAENLRGVLPSDAIVVAMDEGGKEMTSREFAAWMDDLMVGGTRYLTFLVGGAFGLDRDVRKEARQSLSLSRMTLPHELARVVLAEQIYRAMTIIRGEPYHK